jgi:hypothetical protein
LDIVPVGIRFSLEGGSATWAEVVGLFVFIATIILFSLTFAGKSGRGYKKSAHAYGAYTHSAAARIGLN